MSEFLKWSVSMFTMLDSFFIFFYCNTEDTTDKTRQKLLTIPLRICYLYMLLTIQTVISYTNSKIILNYFVVGKLEKNLPLGLRREEARKVWNMGS